MAGTRGRQTWMGEIIAELLQEFGLYAGSTAHMRAPTYYGVGQHT